MKDDEISYDAFGESSPEKIPNFIYLQPWEREGISLEEWQKKYSEYAKKIAINVAKNYDKVLMKTIMDNNYTENIMAMPKMVVSENLIFDPNIYSKPKPYTLYPKRSFMKKLVIGIVIGLVISGIGVGGYKAYLYLCQQEDQANRNKQDEWKSIPQEYKDAICASERYEHFFTIILNEHPEKFSNISMDQLNDIWGQVPHGNSSDDDEWLKKELVKHLDFSSQQVATNK